MTMGPTFVAYIDESGDEGFKFDSGSSLRFILSAAIGLKKDESCYGLVVDAVKDALAKAQNSQHPFNRKKALHFRSLKHEPRKFYTSLIAQQPITAISVFIHKPLFKYKQSLIGEQHLYEYAAGELIRRILWWCSAQRLSSSEGDGTLELVFSNRSSLNCSVISEYCERLFALHPDLTETANRVFRKSQVLALPHSERAGLQIADAIAGSHFYRLEHNSFGQTEESYLTNLSPIIFRMDGEALGFGITVIPFDHEKNEVAEIVDVHTEHEILTEVKKIAAIGPKDPTVDQTAAARNPDEPEGDHR